MPWAIISPPPSDQIANTEFQDDSIICYEVSLVCHITRESSLVLTSNSNKLGRRGFCAHFSNAMCLPHVSLHGFSLLKGSSKQLQPGKGKMFYSFTH